MADAADAVDAAEIHCPSEAVEAAGVEDSQPASHAAAIRGIAATAPPGKPDASLPAAAPATCPAGEV